MSAVDPILLVVLLTMPSALLALAIAGFVYGLKQGFLLEKDRPEHQQEDSYRESSSSAYVTDGDRKEVLVEGEEEEEKEKEKEEGRRRNRPDGPSQVFPPPSPIVNSYGDETVTGASSVVRSYVEVPRGQEDTSDNRSREDVVDGLLSRLEGKSGGDVADRVDGGDKVEGTSGGEPKGKKGGGGGATSRGALRRRRRLISQLEEDHVEYLKFYFPSPVTTSTPASSGTSPQLSGASSHSEVASVTPLDTPPSPVCRSPSARAPSASPSSSSPPLLVSASSPAGSPPSLPSPGTPRFSGSPLSGVSASPSETHSSLLEVEKTSSASYSWTSTSTSSDSSSPTSPSSSSHNIEAATPEETQESLSLFSSSSSSSSSSFFTSSSSSSSATSSGRSSVQDCSSASGDGSRTKKNQGLPQGARTRSSHEHETSDGEHQSAPDHEHALVYEDGVLVAGSLQALVQHAVPTGTYYPDTAYLFAFLLSARLFIKPHELLQRICAVGFAQQGITNSHDASSVKNEQLSNFVRHMVQLLAEWSETFPYDFRDDRLMAGVRSLTHRCIALRPDLRRDVTQVLHNLLNKLTHLERFEESAAKLAAPPPADLIPQPSDISEICASPLVMAQQLTHIELERLSFIGPEEFVQAFAKDNLDTSYKDLKRTCNLEAYIQWFNRLSYLVATHACSHVKRKVRVRLIEWWVEVARECFNIGNFNSLMGVIAGLNMAPVSRMKKTWSKVQSAKFSVLEHQMDPSSNFSSYRSTLKAAMWRSAGALDDRQKIVIPFFSLLVKDLYFLNEGCANRIHHTSKANTLPNGHINFDKFWQLAKQVTEFLAWKQVSCPFTRHPEVITYLLTTQILSETGLALASFECESPENHYEKERYKALKSALNPTT
ncbi:uncharacterized protein LOC143035072 isoform X4 [Oratosquilla oratoria]|uniref:uncharacterized protein LOC143035072 isoform X4 n=1 Tax=Oratosquilla oratoria TaxID=337810 RepID=UPI003F768C12